jgi:hypothetical protein
MNWAGTLTRLWSDGNFQRLQIDINGESLHAYIPEGASLYCFPEMLIITKSRKENCISGGSKPTVIGNILVTF